MLSLASTNSANNNKIENRIYKDTFIVMLLNELSSIGSTFIDVLLITRFFDENAVAAEGIVNPFYSVVGLVSGMLIYGTQKICIRYLGNGNKEKAQSSFNTTLFAGLIAGVTITLIMEFFAGPIVSLLGASKDNIELYTVAIEYLRGLAFCIIPFVMIPILSPIVQVEGKKNYITASLITILILNAILDLVAGYFQLGMFFMGLATSIAQLVGCLIIVFGLTKGSFFKIKISWVNSKELVLVLREGLPKLVKRACKIIKPITVNKMIILIGGVAAMGTVSIRNSFSGLFESAGAALGACIGMLAPLYIGERNEFALNRLIKNSKKFLLLLLIPICVVVIIFASPIALAYASEKPELYQYVVIAIRCVGIDLILMAFVELLMCYWQAISKIKEVSIVVVLQKLILPIISLIVLSNMFGINGVWYSFPVSTALTIVSFFVISIINQLTKKGKQKGLLFAIPEEMLNEKAFQTEIYINSPTEVSPASEVIRLECLKAGIDKKNAYYIALCFEEVVCNIIEHGFKKDKKKEHNIDAFFSIEGQEAILRIRDDCVRFDMVEKFKVFHENGDPLKMIGIRMVMKLAKDINVVNTFSTNSVILKI